MSFQISDYVRVTKLGSVDEPYFPTPTWTEYGEDKGACNSIPTDYVAEGKLMMVPEKDKPLMMERHLRNGVKALGFFRTSYINKIVTEEDFLMVFETMNSRYRMEKILPPIKSESGESQWTLN